jgi:hypothetical protein
MTWDERYASNFMGGRDLGARSAGIEEAIDRILRSPANAREMEMAVDALAAKMARAGGKVYPPSGAEIAGEIIAMRKGRKDGQNGTADGHAIIIRRNVKLRDGLVVTAHEIYIDPERDWQPRLKAESPQDRWTTICEPSSDRDCMERERFCTERGLTVERFVPLTRPATDAIGATP